MWGFNFGGFGQKEINLTKFNSWCTKSTYLVSGSRYFYQSIGLHLLNSSLTIHIKENWKKRIVRITLELHTNFIKN